MLKKNQPPKTPVSNCTQTLFAHPLAGVIQENNLTLPVTSNNTYKAAQPVAPTDTYVASIYDESATIR